MGHQNTQYTSHMINLETDQESHSHLHPEPCIVYGSVANFPQPNIHTGVPAPGNACNFSFHHIPEHNNGALFYGMMQYNGVQHQHPANLDLAVSPPSGHYNPYVAPPSGIRDFPMPVNHGAHDQLSFSGTHRILGIPTDSYGRNIPFMDGARGSFKRKNAEGFPGNYHYQNTSAGASSSFAPVTARPVESEITMTDAATFPPPEYAANDPTSMVESGSHRSVSNRHGTIGPEPILAHNAGHLIQGNFVSQPAHLPGNPWMDVHFSSNNGDIGTFAWNQTPNLPYMHGVNGGCVEAANMGIQGYQVTSSNGSSNSFLPPPIPQGHANLHHPHPPMQGVRGFNMNLPSQVGPSSHRISTISSSNGGINPFQDAVEARPIFLPPVPPTGFRLYQPHRRDIMLDSNTRQRNLHHLRFLPEDEVAMLEIPGYHAARDSVDHHRDMRLDVDHMSYEELLALGEQIGSVNTGLSEEAIRHNLKIGTFVASASCLNLEEAGSTNQETNFCVICQTDYEEQDKLGILNCGHEYHRDCIKKWLLMKNSCPICKSTALSIVKKNM